MSFASWFVKMLVSITIDAVDFFSPPIIGSFYDAIAGGVSMLLWGKKGIFAFGELIDVTDRFDAFIPSLTIIGILSMKEIFRD